MNKSTENEKHNSVEKITFHEWFLLQFAWENTNAVDICAGFRNFDFLVKFLTTFFYVVWSVFLIDIWTLFWLF